GHPRHLASVDLRHPCGNTRTHGRETPVRVTASAALANTLKAPDIDSYTRARPNRMLHNNKGRAA
ncbi:UNVERIFIED_CONTAM: hypothetical protein OHV15_17695, partial [Microbacterium sp. SLM126]